MQPVKCKSWLKLPRKRKYQYFIRLIFCVKNTNCELSKIFGSHEILAGQCFSWLCSLYSYLHLLSCVQCKNYWKHKTWLQNQKVSGCVQCVYWDQIPGFFFVLRAFSLANFWHLNKRCAVLPIFQQNNRKLKISFLEESSLHVYEILTIDLAEQNN
jgi:hypothetical protein